MTTTTRTAMRTRAGLVCLLGITLVGCTASNPGAEDSPPSPADAPTDEADVADAATDTEPSAAPAPEPEASEEPAPTGAQAGAGAACLHGTWLADNEFFLESIRQFGDEITDVSGQVVIDFAADGTLTTDYQDWLITAQAEGIAVTIRRDGTDLGEYTATDSTVSFTDLEMGSMLHLSSAGMEMPIVPEPASYREASYTCDQTAASIVTPDGAMELIRQ